MRFFCKPPLMLVFLIKSYKEDAAAYSGIFAAYPKTVTLTLPGTRLVEILSEISRVKDTSRYIVIGLPLRSLSYPAAFADTFPAGWRAPPRAIFSCSSGVQTFHSAFSSLKSRCMKPR